MTGFLARLGFGPREIDVDCTVEVSNTFESLHAHVTLHGGAVAEPGDEVLVHGREVKVPFGEVQSFQRRATLKKAGPLERFWIRMTGDMEFMELCEFSFSEKVRP
jgi:hypothetical protein